MVQKIRNKKVIIPILLLVIATTGTTVYLASQKNSEQTEDANTFSEQINYDPPTEEELAATEDNKNRLAEEQNATETEAIPQQNSQAEKTKVIPTIGYIESDSASVRSNGFIPSIIEAGGTCTLTLRKGNTIVEANSTSLPDAQGTVCGLIEIASSQVSSGSWTATISYSSSKYQGTSEARTVEVQ